MTENDLAAHAREAIGTGDTLALANIIAQMMTEQPDTGWRIPQMDDDELIRCATLLVSLHTVAKARDFACEVSYELGRRELIGLDDLPDA